MINDFINLVNAAVVETGDSFKALPMILIIGAAAVALILSVAAKGIDQMMTMMIRMMKYNLNEFLFRKFSKLAFYQA